jgi:threonine/homoserine/homoserine lactone efflux protein
MDTTTALLAFSVAAALMTMTPGLDTALVLRTAAVEGGRAAMGAGVGIAAGTLVWGLATALGLGALLAVSETAYALLRAAGAAYLVYLGAGLIRAAFAGAPAMADGGATASGAGGWIVKGLATNLLNPKVGVFYVGFLPQFVPAGADVVAFSVGLAAIHAAMAIGWFALLVGATRRLRRLLARAAVRRGLDGVTGAVLIGLGLRLAFEPR